MRYLFACALYVKLFVLVILCSSFVTPPATLTIVVKNIQPGKGSVVLAVFNSADHFLKKPVAQQAVKATNGTMQASFSLPQGSYAAAIYQDANDNGKLDKNWLGIPKENYGFSNNARPMFSAPAFDDCKLMIKDQTTTAIYLK